MSQVCRHPDIRSARLVVAATTATVLIAACGSTSGVGGTGTVAGTNAASPLKYANCMRSHGVPNFPDPDADGGFAITASSALNPQSPTFAQAARTCAKDFPGGGRPIHLPTRVRERLLAMAQCMRAHGVPNFPDPTFGNGGVGLKLAGAGRLDPNSPAFQTAARTCNGPKAAIAVNPHGGRTVTSGG